MMQRLTLTTATSVTTLLEVLILPGLGSVKILYHCRDW